MSYFSTPLAKTFPPLIPRHFYPPAAAMRGFGQDPAPVDVSNWWTQAQQYAQQYGYQLPGTAPTAPDVPPQPAPAPTPAPPGAPQGTVTGADTSSTLLMYGAIAAIGVIGLVFLIKER